MRDRSFRPADCSRCLPPVIASVCWLLLVVSFPVAVLQAGERTETAPPNIVLIMADDLGYGELGCYGQKWIRTPHLDSLARDGMKFTSFYAGNAVCAPSRCCLMTGRHGGHAHVRNNGSPKGTEQLAKKYGWEFPSQYPLPPEEVTIGEILKEQGYATGAMGKWGLGHFGTTGDPARQGFDLFYGFNAQRHAHNHYPNFLWRNAKKEPQPGNDRTLHGETWSQDQFVKEGLEFIRRHQKQPFLLYLPFAVPHLSIQAPPAAVEEYTGTIPEAEYKHRAYLEHPHPRAGYAAMVTEMDRGIGQILKLLKELDLAENTVVFFTSDNGPTYDRLGGSDSDFFESAGPFRGRKGSLYEGGIRVPLLVRWPGKIAGGTTADMPLGFHDLLPTIAALTGSRTPEGIDGLSFAPLLRGAKDQQPHEILYWEFPAYGGQQALRQGDWKAIRQNMLKKNDDPLRIELYNLKDDPGETRDLAAEQPERVRRMARLMQEARTPSREFPFPPLDRLHEPAN